MIDWCCLLFIVMEEEIARGMRLLGVTKLSELSPKYVECLPA